MTPHYKTYISSLLHNPNLIKGDEWFVVEAENDELAERSMLLLQLTKYFTKEYETTGKINYEGMHLRMRK